MESNGVIAKGSARKKVLPIFLVAVMAIAVFLVAWFARADECCYVNEYCCMQPLAVEKQLDEGVEATPGVKFKFQMILSPEAYNNETSVLDDVTHVHGILYNADGSIANQRNTHGAVIPSTFKLEADHSFTFELEAGQYIVFNWPNEEVNISFEDGDKAAGLEGKCWNPSCLLPFEWTGATYVVNEIVDDDAAAKGYSFSGVTIKSNDYGGVYQQGAFTPEVTAASQEAIDRWTSFFGDGYYSKQDCWLRAYYWGGDFVRPNFIRDSDGTVYAFESLNGNKYTVSKLDEDAASATEDQEEAVESTDEADDGLVEIVVTPDHRVQYGYYDGDSEQLKWTDTVCMRPDDSYQPWPCEGIYSENDCQVYLGWDEDAHMFRQGTSWNEYGSGTYVKRDSFNFGKLIKPTGLYGVGFDYSRWTKTTTGASLTWAPLAFYRGADYAKVKNDAGESVIYRVENITEEDGVKIYELADLNSEDAEDSANIMVNEGDIVEIGFTDWSDHEDADDPEDSSLPRIWWPSDSGWTMSDAPFAWSDDQQRFVRAYVDDPQYELPNTDRTESAKGLEQVPDPEGNHPESVLGVMIPEVKQQWMPTTVIFTNKGRLAPVTRPLTISKELAEGSAEDQNTKFKFELTVSPGFDGDKDPLYAGRNVEGVVTKSDGTGTPKNVTCVFGSGSLDDHTISFELCAGEIIEFLDMPFSPSDTEGTYVLKEVSSVEMVDGEEQVGDKYTLDSIVADSGACAIVSESSEWYEEGVLGTAAGVLGANNPTAIVVTNKQGTPPTPNPERPDDTPKTAEVTISKTLDGVVDADTEFTFEMIVSPEWKNTAEALGYTEFPEFSGTIYGADGEIVNEQTYTMMNNTVKDIKLKAGQRIVFKEVPYLSEDGKPGTIIVNEWLTGDAADRYVMKSYEVVVGDEIGFEAASETKIMNTSDALSTLLAPAGATEATATGVYGEMADGKFTVAFTNGSAHEDGAYGLSIIKNLANFRFDKYASANVVFKVYKFETKEACDAYFDEASEDFGNAENVKWQSVLAMRMTENGEQKAELSGLTEGYYAIEEFSATNMSSAGFTRRFVQIPADDPAIKQFEVRFANTFEDQNLYENSIVNTYKKVVDKDGNIKWQRYQDGKPVGDPVASR